ncbi:MAG: GNAT family N-acetyltransferase [Dehalococcoidia bacterium]|nr:GNAT family N-acetyltransferase [Dehalococcoidia bacterium]
MRPLEPRDVAACERILRSLPEWFAFEEAVARYMRDLESLPGFVAVDGDEVIGFLALRHHNPLSSEVHVMAVRRECHRRGVGAALMRTAEEALAGKVRLLHVKTLGPSHHDEGYKRTRAFYAAMGFVPLEETTAYWGESQPTLVMVKPLP